MKINKLNALLTVISSFLLCTGMANAATGTTQSKSTSKLSATPTSQSKNPTIYVPK